MLEEEREDFVEQLDEDLDAACGPLPVSKLEVKFYILIK